MSQSIPKYRKNYKDLYQYDSEQDVRTVIEGDTQLSSLSIDYKKFILACYNFNQGNYQKVWELTSCSSSQTIPECHYLRGRVLYSQENYAEAYSELKKSYALGFMRSSFLLGFMKYFGLGTGENRDEANKYLQQGTESGYFVCKKMLLHYFTNKSFFDVISLHIDVLKEAYKDEYSEKLSEVKMWKNYQDRHILINNFLLDRLNQQLR